MATPRTYDVRTWSSAPIETVFGLVADVTTWPLWAGRMIRTASWAEQGDPAPGGVGAVRRIGTGPVTTLEKILEYDAPDYLAYAIVSRQPVRDFRGIIALDRENDGTRITWAGTFTPRIPGTGRLVCWLLRRIVGGMASGLARYSSAEVTVADRAS